jgi:hypothetical protein
MLLSDSRYYFQILVNIIIQVAITYESELTQDKTYFQCVPLVLAF